MSHRIAVPLLAASLLAVYGLTTEAETVAADPIGLFDDADGDFVPDTLEWILLTDPADADTDDDGASDFVEAVQGGYPRDPDPVPLPRDDEMRVLVTTRADETGVSMLWVHAMFRLMNGLDTRLDNVAPWIAVDGTKYPLPDLFDGVPLFWRVLETGAEGTLVIISAPVASEETGRNLLPFTFGISARLGGREISSSAHYSDADGRTAILVALDADRPALQTLQQAREEGPLELPNRVCALTLAVVGNSPGGLLVQVIAARCEAAHGLRCASTCSQLGDIGRTFVLPDGMSTISGR